MNSLEKAIEILDGQSSLARGISAWLAENGCGNKKIKQQHVWRWLNHPSGIPTVPAEYRLAIEEITDRRVTCRDLSHDIYGLRGPAAQQEQNLKEKA